MCRLMSLPPGISRAFAVPIGNQFQIHLSVGGNPSQNGMISSTEKRPGRSLSLPVGISFLVCSPDKCSSDGRKAGNRSIHRRDWRSRFAISSDNVSVAGGHLHTWKIPHAPVLLFVENVILSKRFAVSIGAFGSGGHRLATIRDHDAARGLVRATSFLAFFG